MILTSTKGWGVRDGLLVIPHVFFVGTSPAATDSFPWFRTFLPLWLHYIEAQTNTGTVTGNYERRTVPETAGTDIFTSDQTFTTTFTKFAPNVRGVGPGGILHYSASAVASSPTRVSVYLFAESRP